MSAGDEGILGNLPRERPGTRSGKRTGAARSTPSRTPKSKPEGSAGSTRAAAPPPPPPPTQQDGTDALGEAARVAGQVAGAGIRAAARVARGVVGRLPRP